MFCVLLALFFFLYPGGRNPDLYLEFRFCALHNVVQIHNNNKTSVTSVLRSRHFLGRLRLRKSEVPELTPAPTTQRKHHCSALMYLFFWIQLQCHVDQIHTAEAPFQCSDVLVLLDSAAAPRGPDPHSGSTIPGLLCICSSGFSCSAMWPRSTQWKSPSSALMSYFFVLSPQDSAAAPRGPDPHSGSTLPVLALSPPL